MAKVARSLGTWVLIASSSLAFANLFVPWNRACGEIPTIGFVCDSFTGWHGLGLIIGALAVSLVVLEALPLLGVKVRRTAGLVSAALAAGLVAFTIAKLAIDHAFISFGSWIGVLLATAIALGGWVRLRDASDAPAVIVEAAAEEAP